MEELPNYLEKWVSYFPDFLAMDAEKGGFIWLSTDHMY